MRSSTLAFPWSRTSVSTGSKCPRAACGRRSAGLRATYTVSPRSFLGALVQYNSAAQLFSANIRYRWEYSPGSDLFVVFSTNRDGDDGLSGLSDRALVVKFTRLFRF